METYFFISTTLSIVANHDEHKTTSKVRTPEPSITAITASAWRPAPAPADSDHVQKEIDRDHRSTIIIIMLYLDLY